MHNKAFIEHRIAVATEELGRSIREHKPYAILEYETYIARLHKELSYVMRDERDIYDVTGESNAFESMRRS